VTVSSRAAGPLPQGATRVERMRRKLQTKVGAAIYSKRKTVVEPVFGQIKQARRLPAISLRVCRRCKASGPGLSDAQHSEVTSLCYGSS